MVSKPKVIIVMGSRHDLPVMEEAAGVLCDLGVSYRMVISSAHRAPRKTASLALSARKKGAKVIIAGAGLSAHLAGTIAAYTTLPVIGVPLDGPTLLGIDALLSTVQMPAGIPVATMAIGKTGARNAGIMAAEILALSDERLSRKLMELKEDMARKVGEDDKTVARNASRVSRKKNLCARRVACDARRQL